MFVTLYVSKDEQTNPTYRVFALDCNIEEHNTNPKIWNSTKQLNCVLTEINVISNNLVFLHVLEVGSPGYLSRLWGGLTWFSFSSLMWAHTVLLHVFEVGSYGYHPRTWGGLFWFTFKFLRWAYLVLLFVFGVGWSGTVSRLWCGLTWFFFMSLRWAHLNLVLLHVFEVGSPGSPWDSLACSLSRIWGGLTWFFFTSLSWSPPAFLYVLEVGPSGSPSRLWGGLTWFSPTSLRWLAWYSDTSLKS